MAEHAPDKFAVPQRLWRATVENTVDKIRAWQQAVIATEVHPKIYSHTADEDQRKRLLGLAKSGQWLQDPWLSRHCRIAFAGKQPRPRRSGRIVADNCSYDVRRDQEGRAWLGRYDTHPQKAAAAQSGRITAGAGANFDDRDQR